MLRFAICFILLHYTLSSAARELVGSFLSLISEVLIFIIEFPRQWKRKLIRSDVIWTALRAAEIWWNNSLVGEI